MSNIKLSEPGDCAESLKDKLFYELAAAVTFVETHIDNQFKGGVPRSPLDMVSDTAFYLFSDTEDHERRGNYLPYEGVTPPEDLGSDSLSKPFLAMRNTFQGEFEFIDSDALVTVRTRFGVPSRVQKYYVEELILRRKQIYVSGRRSVTRHIGIKRDRYDLPLEMQLKDIVYLGSGVAYLEFDVPRDLDDVKGTILSELKDVEPPSIDYLPNHNNDIIELNRQGRKTPYHVRWNSISNFYSVILDESNRDDFRFLEEIGFRENYKFGNSVEYTISPYDLWVYFNPEVRVIREKYSSRN